MGDNSNSKEKIWFHINRHWYTGKLPAFYDTTQLPSAAILERNYEAIKKEVMDYYAKEGDKIKPNFVWYNDSMEGWHAVDMMSYNLLYPGHIKKFPVVWGIVSKIPNVVSVQISILKAHSRIRPHMDDSNAIIRHHLGLVVPGKYPELGFRGGSTETCWEEGKVFAMCMAHRHLVWNNTEGNRIILVVDTVHPDFADRKFYVCAGLLVAAVFKIIVAKIPLTARIPEPVVLALHRLGTFGAMMILKLQRLLNPGIRFNPVRS